jgi:hypothetical protein
MVDTVFLAGDHAIFHDTGHALALIPEAFREPRQAISPVERDRFTPLAHSGIRNTADLLWYALNGHEALGRFALGVRSDGSTYELLAECSAVSPDMLMRAAAAVASDHRVHEFAIRPVEPGDPALADTDIVIPLRRDPEAPRSPAVIMGDALPLGPDLDLEPHEIEAIRVFATRSGAIRASLALVESRSLVEVTDRTIARDPVHVVIHSRRLFESRYPVLLFADGQAKDGHARLRLEGQLQDALDGRLADRAPRVRVTDAEDPLLGAASYAIRLV